MDELRNAAKWLSVAMLSMSVMLVCFFLTSHETPMLIIVFFVAAAVYFCAMAALAGEAWKLKKKVAEMKKNIESNGDDV